MDLGTNKLLKTLVSYMKKKNPCVIKVLTLFLKPNTAFRFWSLGCPQSRGGFSHLPLSSTVSRGVSVSLSIFLSIPQSFLSVDCRAGDPGACERRWESNHPRVSRPRAGAGWEAPGKGSGLSPYSRVDSRAPPIFRCCQE